MALKSMSWQMGVYIFYCKYILSWTPLSYYKNIVRIVGPIMLIAFFAV